MKYIYCCAFVLWEGNTNLKIMTKLHEKTTRKCPKCKSRFGVILTKNIYKGKSQVLCFNGNCDWKMNIVEWNNIYTRSQFIDSGFKSVGK